MVLGKSQTQIYADLHAASPSSAPSASRIFRWIDCHFSGRKFGVPDFKGKVMNKTKRGEKLIAHVDSCKFRGR